MSTASAIAQRMVVQLEVHELERLVERAVERALARHAGKQPAGRPNDRLTFNEFIAEYRCSARQGRRLIASGRVRAEKLTDGGSSRVFIRRSEIDKLTAESSK